MIGFPKSKLLFDMWMHLCLVVHREQEREERTGVEERRREKDGVMNRGRLKRKWSGEAERKGEETSRIGLERR